MITFKTKILSHVKPLTLWVYSPFAPIRIERFANLKTHEKKCVNDVNLFKSCITLFCTF